MSTILIIDDDAKITRMLIRRLTKKGFEVHTAENGKIGFERAMKLVPDLILMDMHMPVMDGYQATRLLREKGYKGLITALTASAMAHQTPKAMEAGCDYFLSKPIDTNFETEIENILQDKS